MNENDILQLARWSTPKEVQTKYGPRILRKAAVTPEFSEAWKAHKEEIKRLGAGFSKDQNGQWELTWWQELSPEEKQRRAAAVEASRAASSDCNLPRPDGLEYLPFQKAGIQYALARPNVLFADEPGLGKQQPVDSLVLTPDGWKPIGTLRVNDLVIGASGKPVTVLGVYPQGVKPSYRVTLSDTSAVEAGPEHLWTVFYRCGGRIMTKLTLTTEQLRTRPVIRRYSEKTGGYSSLDLSKTTLYIPMLSAPVEFHKNMPLPIPPYTLGQMIANGYLTGSSVVITVGANDADEVIKNVKTDGAPVGSINRYSTAVHIGINDKTICKVRELGLNIPSASKFIPRIYQTASIEDRISLLHGLMDGDGSISASRNRVTYHTCSAALASDVVELVEGLGGIASVRQYTRSDGKPDEYQVRIRLPKGIVPFTIARKATRYNPEKYSYPCRTVVSVDYVRDVESVCIAVDAEDRLYCTEHCILTHNTIQAIGVINTDQAIKSVIIICPKSLKLNWKRELERWLVRRFTIAVPDGNWVNADIVILNYESLGKYIERIKAHGAYDVCIVDEAHRMKNPKTLTSKNVKSIQARRHIRITGTPIVNRPAELYNIICDLAAPGVFGSFFQYAKRYCGAHNNGFGWDFGGATNLDELQTRLRQVCMVRRLKQEVLTELPRKIRQIIEIEPDDTKQRLAVGNEAKFNATSEDRLADLQAAVELSKAESEAAYQDAVKHLRELSAADFTEISRLRHETALSKVPAVIDHIRTILEDDEQQKVIVAGHHHDVIEQIKNGLLEYRPVVLTGETNTEDRQRFVDAFQQDPATRVFIGSITAAGVGITLTAANIVIFAELDWVPGNMSQMEDRAHRIGQVDTVLVQHLVLSGSIDASTAKILVEKQTIIDKALDTMHPERHKPVDKPRKEAGTSAETVESLALIAEALSPEEIETIHVGLRILAGMDQDMAADLNGVGFSKIDTRIGHDLALRTFLTPKQAALGLKLIKKYRRQLPKEILQVV